LAGWVQNEADLVRIEVAGDAAAVDEFLHTLRHGHPPQAHIDAIQIAELPPENGASVPWPFEIRSSASGASPRPSIPADLATCADCLAEIRGPSERRFGYPFTNCTNCGPRWSIIRELPYDRPRTSMASFPMCPDCQYEYDDPADRRFHAQPIACPACGPALELLDAHGQQVPAEPSALEAATNAILSEHILALKGLGGFQLLADATNENAVALLRRRKHRPDRPFALMFPSLEAVGAYCEVSEEEARVLASHQAPILLLRRNRHTPHPTSRFPLAPSVAPGNPYLGAMLPYTPLHHLLMDRLARPLVCTSGNLSEEPMAITTEDAIERLGAGVHLPSGEPRREGATAGTQRTGIADLLLTHNRPIVRPMDDSVARIGPEGFQVLRRARGYAPLPVMLRFAAPTILAVGGHLKNTVALSLGVGQISNLPSAGTLRTCSTPVILSPHIGDLDSVLSVEVFRRAIDDLTGFFQVTPKAVACDLHPDYASTRHAEALAERWGVPLIAVQHHHAHVAACMAEHGLDGPALGLSWDGTGYGPDGTVWGGEALACEGAGFRRVAQLRTFALPGGDRAMREPRRSALGLLYEFLDEDVVGQASNLPGPTPDWFTKSELKTLLSLLSRGLHTPRTSSMGRLFDAAAAICGLPRVISFEGQAAMALEFAADPDEHGAYPFPLVPRRVSVPLARPSDGGGWGIAERCPSSSANLMHTPLGHRSAQPQPPQAQPQPPEFACQDSLDNEKPPTVADWEPLVRAILADRAAGEPVARIAARFHNSLADLAVAMARHAALRDVILSGGCFQNALLAERVRSRLLEAGFSVFTHHTVPPGDGGIALGQVFVAARQTQG
jgi:hydrogenase maturation protein HypF